MTSIWTLIKSMRASRERNGFNILPFKWKHLPNGVMCSRICCSSRHIGVAIGSPFLPAADFTSPTQFALILLFFPLAPESAAVQPVPFSLRAPVAKVPTRATQRREPPPQPAAASEVHSSSNSLISRVF